jgi:hypothetical protein
MAEVRSARKRAPLPGQVTGVISYRVVLVAAGILLAVLLAAFVPLTMASHDLHQSADDTTPVMALALAAVGMVVASRLPRNPDRLAPGRQRAGHDPVDRCRTLLGA